ncbi:MAG: replicative DNA helicase [Candidatus Cloacimonetes bacterium]|nr:replicative DNA helicase [Candidatus Cloacimonadota bacterium]
MNISERQKPQDQNAEAAVLAAMMIDNHALAKAIERLTDVNFYPNANKIIFRTMQDMFVKSIEIDPVTLINQLINSEKLDVVGGTTYINELNNAIISGAHIDYHIEIVLEKSTRRMLIEAGTQIIQNAYKTEDDLAMLVDQSEQLIFAIAEKSNETAFKKVENLMPETMAQINDLMTQNRPIVGVPSGFHALDKKLSGMRPGQLIILAARPSMGKTALALNIALHNAMLDRKIGIFSMEMPSRDVILRMMSTYSQVEMGSLMKGFNMNEEKVLRLHQFHEAMIGKDLFVDDSGSNSALDIRAKSRRLKAEIDGLDLIIIDYLQLMSSKGARKEGRQQEIADISRQLKMLAKELEVPIVALSQLNRATESREDKRPQLSDLRESGAIEQDADVVLFIHRDEYYTRDKCEKPGIAEVIIGKNRNGPTGTAELEFVAQFTWFRNMEDSGESL